MRVPPASMAFSLLLSYLVALPSFGIDVSLPALTAMGAALHVGPAQAGLMMSLVMRGFAVAPRSVTCSSSLLPARVDPSNDSPDWNSFRQAALRRIRSLALRSAPRVLIRSALNISYPICVEPSDMQPHLSGRLWSGRQNSVNRINPLVVGLTISRTLSSSWSRAK
jgi:hypothetical protein